MQLCALHCGLPVCVQGCGRYCAGDSASNAASAVRPPLLLCVYISLYPRCVCHTTCTLLVQRVCMSLISAAPQRTLLLLLKRFFLYCLSVILSSPLHACSLCCCACNSPSTAVHSPSAAAHATLPLLLLQGCCCCCSRRFNF